jgi:hypothetical protein
MHKICIDTVHTNFNFIQFIYAEQLSVYIAKATVLAE